MFESERVAFQYEHNYWKLPVAMDDTSVIHTSGTSLVISFGYIYVDIKLSTYNKMFHYQQRRNRTS